MCTPFLVPLVQKFLPQQSLSMTCIFSDIFDYFISLWLNLFTAMIVSENDIFGSYNLFWEVILFENGNWIIFFFLIISLEWVFLTMTLQDGKLKKPHLVPAWFLTMASKGLLFGNTYWDFFPLWHLDLPFVERPQKKFLLDKKNSNTKAKKPWDPSLY